MKTLIQAIQTALRNAAGLAYISDADIFITADENLLPVTAGFPAIGLKDGDVNILIEEGPDWERTPKVDIIIYVLLSEGETAVIGQADPLIHGVLDISKDVHSILYDNKLEITAIETALPVAETGSYIVGTDDLVLLARKLTYQYRKLEVNP